MVHSAQLRQDLTADLAASRRHSADRPFDNPVLDLSLDLLRRLRDGSVDLATVRALVGDLRDDAFRARAARIDRYVGGSAVERSQAALDDIVVRLAAAGLDAFRRETGRVRFAAVFTAHPTFSLPPEIAAELAETATTGVAPPARHSHRPSRPSLADEFAQACAGIARGRTALDRLTHALLATARERWPDAWTGLRPQPIVLASWVGYDTDGRTDVNWWDTLRFRLQMKSMQLARVAEQVAGYPCAAPVQAVADAARRRVDRQVAACPVGERISADAVSTLAQALVGGRDEALTSSQPLLDLFDQAIAAAPDADKLALGVARAGLASHGLALAHTQFRLNATQLHNALRQLADLHDPAEDALLRRGLFTAINSALDRLEPQQVDFGSLLAEASSAVRLLMLIAQVVKHVDRKTPVRLHIAETETGYTLLCALWLVRAFGLERHVQISPLLETAEGLENGAKILDEALRSRHWRDYLNTIGVLAIEFGYSDSGRYVGQLAASYLIERQRLKIAETLARHGITGIEIILFDTHGESIGRGAHPYFLLDRLKFLSPTRSRKELTRAGLQVCEESAFQGGDGFLLFGTDALALATIARMAEHVFDPDAKPDAKRLPPDPVYDDPDFSADFFGTVRSEMEALVEDPGYVALLGTFGPALLEATGSRPSARQVDGMGSLTRINHPRELRAIPNNAILQQLGFCLNTFHGLGAALGRHRDTFNALMQRSPRYRRAMDFAAHALLHSDLQVLQAVIATLDPGQWLNRATRAGEPVERHLLSLVSGALEQLGIVDRMAAVLRRVQRDHLLLRNTWQDAPQMSDDEMLLHAVRLALIQQIWLLAVEIPSFSPRHGFTRQMLLMRLLRLDVDATVQLLLAIFPPQPEMLVDADFAEPRGIRSVTSYERESREIFTPISILFDLVREIGTAVTHSVGAMG